MDRNHHQNLSRFGPFEFDYSSPAKFVMWHFSTLQLIASFGAVIWLACELMTCGLATKSNPERRYSNTKEEWCQLKALDQHDWLFPSRKKRTKHLSTLQYARLVERWITSIDLPRSSYATHSLRRTKATLIYRKTENLRAVQLLLGHTKIDSTL